MKKVNSLQTIKSLFLLFILLTGIQYCFAGKRIDGNGTIQTLTKTLDQFYAIDIETFCNVTVINGAMPMMKLKIDENLVEYINIEVENGKLRVSSDEWIEATQLELTVQTSFITSLNNSGWGKIKIENLATDQFQLFAKTGDIRISGKVNSIQIETGTARINAENLVAKSIAIDKESHGKIYLNKSESLNISGNTEFIFVEGKSYYEEIGTTKTEKKKPVNYVQIKIRNNSILHRSLVIRGPKNRKFSYGFSMFPYATKKEKVPVGTRFLKDQWGGEKLLITIKAEDDGKTLNLFK